jgi:hypothetical protein
VSSLLHLRTETDPISETSCFWYGKVQKPSNSWKLYLLVPSGLMSPCPVLYAEGSVLLGLGVSYTDFMFVICFMQYSQIFFSSSVVISVILKGKYKFHSVYSAKKLP